ncbi:uncharacterized protein LOC130445305 [Diorhabda sublineata]|uniref:uncharacterized protein LOC130445305 n=1 Tax=Diorhabda sublineata TaxID=1163346 RepID=UPI0024E16D03|nr:uncharacterized protein LOC130445305 [Diorhabda sublineata]
MGCSAAKNLTVEPLDASLTNGHAETRTSPLAPQPQHNLPPLEAEDLQEELIENNTVNNVLHGVNGVSFEIAFEEEDNDDSIVKKHPPKRILERLEEPSTSPVTLEKLQEKLDEAETRRQQILAQRIQSAGMKTQWKKPLNNNNETEEGDFLRVPVVPVEPVSKINNNNNDLSYW